MEQIKEVIFTYETLYELLRKEKGREELQKIDMTFYRDILRYLKDKQSTYDDSLAKNDVFSQSEREKLQIQLNNAKRLMRDLYDLRERKIVGMALNFCRTKSHLLDASNLLPEENMMFQSLCSVLGQHRTGIVQHLLELRDPQLLPIVLPVPGVMHSESSIPSPPPKKQVKFLENMEPFADQELEMYGPFEKNDEATLPRELADVLISQGKAVEL
ncbi:MAG TPA: hypothetical protein VJJ82_01420 [Candidatus Nanoarchaeia archaeon]|nr:hypothetical protein [Candidatus Nanoarchaeia archaeon]